VSALAFVLSAAAFADSRHQGGTWRGGYNNSNRRCDGYDRTYGDNERVTIEGKVRSFSRERDGYRMQLDRSGYSFWVPESRLRNLPRGRGLIVGLYVSGTVDGIDFRRGTLWLRDNASGRLIEVDMRDADQRSSRIGLDDLQRDDYISLSGEWLRGGLFAAYRVHNVRTGPY
jgi:hypothetical protein